MMFLMDMFLLFAVGSVLGVAVETVYVYLATGRLESRRGMVYGPFNQVYGLGAVLLTALLAPLAGESRLALFLGSAVLGGLFEALCSFFQEKAYGTVSWEYSGQRLSLLGGRTSVTYMLFWGVLGSIYIRVLHPWLFGLFGKMPPPVKVPVVLALTAFLAYDLWLSNAAVRRWNQRLREAPAAGEWDLWLDMKFPDARMRRLYPSMVPASHPEKPKRPRKTRKKAPVGTE